MYGHYCLLVYIYSRLWFGEVSDGDLVNIRILIDKYLSKICEFYDDTEFTINCHQLIHLPKTVGKLGPLHNLTAFPFEHMNGVLVKCVKSGYGIIEQIMNKFEIKMITNLKYKKNKDNAFSASSNYKYKNKKCFKKITKNNLVITSSNNSKSKFRDYYVKCKNSEYFKVLYYFEQNSQLYFEGIKIDILGPLQFIVDDITLNLDYILDAKQTTARKIVEVDSILDRVLFVTKFEKGKSSYGNINLGFIINFVHKLHN